MAVTAYLSVFALIAFVVLVGQQVAAGVFVGHRPPFPLPDNAGLLFLPQDTGSGYRPLPLRRGDIYGWAFLSPGRAGRNRTCVPGVKIPCLSTWPRPRVKLLSSRFPRWRLRHFTEKHRIGLPYLCYSLLTGPPGLTGRYLALTVVFDAPALASFGLWCRRVESNHPHRKGSPARTACGICPASPGVNYFFRFLK